MEEKKYLKWYNKVGYGSGDIAGNVVFAFLSSFIMIYLTNTVGLNAGVIGSLIAASKVLDGISDVVFGSMIDRTHTKMGKARPWMLGAYFGCAITLIAAFSVPTTMGKTSQYVWFFITYLLLNAGFYTANNIAYSTLTALITKNVKERVQMGSIRFMFAFGTSFIIQTITVGLVQKLGGGAEGWRTIAIIYAIIGLISNTLTVFSVKELPEEELRNGEEKVEEKYSLIESIKMLVHNKYYIVILVVDILRQTYSAIINCGIYYMTYVLGKAELLGTFSGAINLALIVGLAFLPMLVAKYKGYYKLNFSGYLIVAAGRGIVIIAGYMGNVPLMLAGTAIGAIGMAPWQGNLNALVAECSEHTFLQYGKRIDGTMYSCTSMGLKIGSGLGTAIVGWLLNFGGFNGQLKVQSQSCINMLHFMYLWLPMIINILVALLLTQLNVEKANEKLINDFRKTKKDLVDKAGQEYEELTNMLGVNDDDNKKEQLDKDSEKVAVNTVSQNINVEKNDTNNLKTTDSNKSDEKVEETKKSDKIKSNNMEERPIVQKIEVDNSSFEYNRNLANTPNKNLDDDLDINLNDSFDDRMNSGDDSIV